MKECLNYKIFDSQTVQCQTCSHFCKIKDGQVGICGVRQNINGKLKLLVYGKAIAANIDPIEKKPLFHFLPGSDSYSFGTLGCNFRCNNCQNYDISQIYGLKGKVQEYNKIPWGHELSPEQIVRDALKQNCSSIAYTYNEPTIFLEYALDTMKLAHEKGLKNVWVSNGYMSSETLDLIIPYLDAINVDIKSLDDKFYVSNCGAHVEPVLKNCQRLIHPASSGKGGGVKEKIWLEVTTLIIPTLSDDEKMFKELALFIASKLGKHVPWHISAFSGAISWKLQHLPDSPLEKIKKAYQIGKDAGLKYVYGGNVWDSEIERTVCPKCDKIVIERSGYQVIRHDKKGKCPGCGEKIEGVF